MYDFIIVEVLDTVEELEKDLADEEVGKRGISLVDYVKEVAVFC